MAPPNARIFSAILERPSAWRRLSGSGLGVALMYGGLLVAVLQLPQGAPAALPSRPTALVVTLFDAPTLPEMQALAAGGAAPKLSLGAVSTEVAAVRPAPADKQALRAREKGKVEPARATADNPTEPSPQVAAAVTTPVVTPEVAPTSPTASTGLPSGGATLAQVGSASATGGSGAGAGGTGGAGGLAGRQARGNDDTVLPFLDGMTRPTLLSKVEPIYTREARDANVEGLILAKCVITTGGELRRCRIVKGLPLMDQQVLSALAQWRYSPVIYQGRAVQIDYVVSVRLVKP